MINCPHCGLNVIHTGMCPRIAAIEYNENGTIRRVEYVQPPSSPIDWREVKRMIAPASENAE